MQKMLTSSVNESKVIRSLKEEIARQKTLLVEREHKVTELLETEKLGREHKESILKDLELVKGERDVQANEAIKKEAIILDHVDMINK